MAITAAMVKELRDMTGAGMMDAKKALVETDGNIDKAVDLLREKGLAAAAKKAGRIAAEGVVQSYIHAGGRIGVLVEVNCETDFVAKTDDFQSLARDIAMQIAAVNPAYLNREEVPAEVIEHEKQVLLEQAKVEAEEDVKAGRIAAEGVVQSYIHAGGRIGVLVEVNCETDFVAKTDDFQNLARDIAMQIAAVNPTYLNREEVPAEVIEHEKQVLLEQAKAEAEEDVKAGRKPKPEAVLEKMVNGRIEKFYKENCLLEQAFIKDGDKTVTDIINENIAKIGENINVRRFVRYGLGEGIEKRQDDFVAEVMASVGK